jgi:hypothetical protein
MRSRQAILSQCVTPAPVPCRRTSSADCMTRDCWRRPTRHCTVGGRNHKQMQHVSSRIASLQLHPLPSLRVDRPYTCTCACNPSDLLEIEFLTRGKCGLEIGDSVEIIFRRLTRVHILRERLRLHRLRVESDGLVDRGLNLTVDDAREHASEYDRHQRDHGHSSATGRLQNRRCDSEVSTGRRSLSLMIMKQLKRALRHAAMYSRTLRMRNNLNGRRN